MQLTRFFSTIEYTNQIPQNEKPGQTATFVATRQGLSNLANIPSIDSAWASHESGPQPLENTIARIGKNREESGQESGQARIGARIGTYRVQLKV
jgi:hypothetical protein